MQTVSLPYGKSSLALDLRHHPHSLVLEPRPSLSLENPLERVREALRAPMGTAPLVAMLNEKKPRNVVVVVNDETRPTPYEVFFPPLLESFREAGIGDDQVTFLIATGLHAPHSHALNESVFGAEMARRFRFVSHEADDEDSLCDMGVLSSGLRLRINRLAVDADFLITLGVVMPHYFAGFSGGRKSILPGIAGRESIENNHARMVDLVDNLPELRSNPLSLEMIEAARRLGVDFICNAVLADDLSIVGIFAGDLEEAWYAAADAAASVYDVPFARQADICIISASGYPRDVNAYQAQKALDHADRVTRKGGTIVLVAACEKGLGGKTFEEWLSLGLSPQGIIDRIRTHFVMGGHKAYGYAKVARDKKVLLVSSLTEEVTQRLFATKLNDLQAFYDTSIAKAPETSVIIIPEGGITHPCLRASS